MKKVLAIILLFLLSAIITYIAYVNKSRVIESKIIANIKKDINSSYIDISLKKDGKWLTKTAIITGFVTSKQELENIKKIVTLQNEISDIITNLQVISYNYITLENLYNSLFLVPNFLNKPLIYYTKIVKKDNSLKLYGYCKNSIRHLFILDFIKKTYKNYEIIDYLKEYENFEKYRFNNIRVLLIALNNLEFGEAVILTKTIILNGFAFTIDRKQESKLFLQNTIDKRYKLILNIKTPRYKVVKNLNLKNILSCFLDEEEFSDFSEEFNLCQTKLNKLVKNLNFKEKKDFLKKNSSTLEKISKVLKKCENFDVVLISKDKPKIIDKIKTYLINCKVNKKRLWVIKGKMNKNDKRLVIKIKDRK